MYRLVECFGLICEAFAFLYGAHVSFKKKGVLFLQIVTCAFGCFLLCDIYNLCYSFCLENYGKLVEIEKFGYMGGLTFLFSSYYGAMDRIGDNQSKELIKYRIISLIPIILNIFLYIFLNSMTEINIHSLICMVLLSGISYFALKNVILPDVEDGILSSMRVYNVLILSLCIFQSLHNALLVFCPNATIISKAVSYVIVLFCMPTAYSGVKKWYI